MLTALPVQAAEPIRLQVIPYEAGWGSVQIPVHNFQGTLQAPPSLMPDLPIVEGVQCHFPHLSFSLWSGVSQ